jgi:hypothetical protein
MEQKKKLTNGQLQRMIKNALVFVPKDKDYKGIWFEDKGLRLEITNESAIISTNYHRHVFSNITGGGISRPYLYTRRVIEIATENDCRTEDGYSYHKLLETLHAKEDQKEYNICVYYEWYVFNMFQPLYSIGESEAETFLVYESYVHNMARNEIVLSEKTEDITNRQFIDRVAKNLKDFTSNLPETVLFKKLSDEEYVKENIEAIQEQEMNAAVENGEE